MTKVESIGATLLLVAASSLPLVSCDKEKPATETPAGEEPAMSDEPIPGDAEPADDAGDTATSGEVDHEAMSHGDAAEGEQPPPEDG